MFLVVELFTQYICKKIKIAHTFFDFFSKKMRGTGFLTVPRRIYYTMYYDFMIDELL